MAVFRHRELDGDGFVGGVPWDNLAQGASMTEVYIYMTARSAGGYRTSLWFRWLAFFAAYIIINIVIRLVSGQSITSGYLTGQLVNAAVGASLWVAFMHFFTRRRKSAQPESDGTQR